MKKVYEQLLGAIPDYKAFLTVAEMDDSARRLAEAFPDVVSLREIGKTQEGRPLLCLKIGEDVLDETGKPRNMLLLGLPHPNEPIGAMMLEHLTWELGKSPELRRELGYTVYVVKAWDLDGAMKNEGWFKGPFTVTHYMRNFFRPAGHQQVDWTFPVDYKELHFDKPIPETVAVMKLIDEVQPRMIYNLHNAGFGGAYWYMSAPTPEIFKDLLAIPPKYKVPLHMGEPESNSAPIYDTAIYGCLGITSEYDHMEKFAGQDMKELVKSMSSGDCSAAYAREKYGSFTLLAELPYFYDSRIEDLSPSDISRRDALILSHKENEATNTGIFAILAALEPHMNPRNQYLMAVKSFTSFDGGGIEALTALLDSDPKYDKPATVAEKFDSLLGSSKFYKTLNFALMLGGSEYELRQMALTGEENPEKKAGLEAGRALALAAFDAATAVLEEQLNYSAVPIRSLVGVQLESGLRVAEYLKEHNV